MHTALRYSLMSFLTLAIAAVAWAQRAGYEFYGHYPDSQTAHRIANLIKTGNNSRYDDAYVEAVPRMPNSWGVYARLRGSNGPSGPATTFNGSITRGSAMDRVRQGCHANVHTMNFAANRTYQLDLISPRGTSSFDTWLRIEDSTGRALANDDDSGEGLNSRITFRPPRSGTYRLVVTTYSRGATGSYELTVR